MNTESKHAAEGRGKIDAACVVNNQSSVRKRRDISMKCAQNRREQNVEVRRSTNKLINFDFTFSCLDTVEKFKTNSLIIDGL